MGIILLQSRSMIQNDNSMLYFLYHSLRKSILNRTMWCKLKSKIWQHFSNIPKELAFLVSAGLPSRFRFDQRSRFCPKFPRNFCCQWIPQFFQGKVTDIVANVITVQTWLVSEGIIFTLTSQRVLYRVNTRPLKIMVKIEISHEISVGTLFKSAY